MGTNKNNQMTWTITFKGGLLEVEDLNHLKQRIGTYSRPSSERVSRSDTESKRKLTCKPATKPKNFVAEQFEPFEFKPLDLAKFKKNLSPLQGEAKRYFSDVLFNGNSKPRTAAILKAIEDLKPTTDR